LGCVELSQRRLTAIRSSTRTREATELIDQRIDQIFLRPGQPGMRIDIDSVALLGAPVNGHYPSDHMGVLCELAWPVPTAGDA
jgi:hypothetical protein